MRESPKRCNYIGKRGQRAGLCALGTLLDEQDLGHEMDRVAALIGIDPFEDTESCGTPPEDGLTSASC
jgi:hypothetical protein